MLWIHAGGFARRCFAQLSHGRVTYLFFMNFPNTRREILVQICLDHVYFPESLLKEFWF